MRRIHLLRALTASVEAPPPPPPPPPSGGLPTTVTVENWSSDMFTPSPGRHRMGLPFRRGDVPAGQVPTLTRAGGSPVVQFDEAAYWDDGSLKFCVAHLRDTEFSAGEARPYTIDRATGTFSNTSSGTLSALVAAAPLSVAFAQLEQFSDKVDIAPVSAVAAGAWIDCGTGFESISLTNPAGAGSVTVRVETSPDQSAVTSVHEVTINSWPWVAPVFKPALHTPARYVRIRVTAASGGAQAAGSLAPYVVRASGAALASLATHATVATRVTRVHAGPVCDSWLVWGMARDGAAGAGSEDAHLKVVWYVSAWKDASGAVVDIEHLATVTQDWWGVAAKYRLGYDATLRIGSAAVQAYAAVDHPYHAAWHTVRMANDHGYGRRHWLNAMPTLLTKPNKAYWVSTNLVPPIDTTYTFGASSASAAYVPCGAVNHRTAINGTGGYAGRGLITDMDVRAFASGSAQDMRYARTNALVLPPVRYRSNLTRTRASESADTANSILVQRMDPGTKTVWTGLPASDYYYASSASGGWVRPEGGNLAAGGPHSGNAGVFTVGSYWDTSHWVAYAYYSYLVEGERHQLEAIHDNAAGCNAYMYGNEYGGRTPLPYYTVPEIRAALSIPSTNYSAVGPSNANPVMGNHRSAAWGTNAVAAVCVTPATHEAAEYWADLLAHTSNYLTAAAAYIPADIKAAGMWGDARAETPRNTINSPWNAHFIALAAYHAYLRTGLAGFAAMGEVNARRAVGMMQPGRIYSADTYRALGAPDVYASDWTTAGWYPAGEAPVFVDNGMTCASSVLTPRWNFAQGGHVNLPLRNGDPVYFLPISGYGQGTDFNGNAWIMPAGYTRGTRLYAVNCSGNTLQVSTTPGGSPMTLADGVYSAAVVAAAWGDYTVQSNPPYISPGDSFAMAAYAALVIAKRAGNTEVTDTLLNAAKTFIAPVNSASENAAVWRFN